MSWPSTSGAPPKLTRCSPRRLPKRASRSHRFAADLADPAAVDALVPAVIEKFGRAPGSARQRNAALFAEGEWTDLSADALSEMMQVNHHAPVMLAKRRSSPRAKPRDPRSSTSSTNASSHPVPDQIAYSLPKSALWQATATLAVAFGEPRAHQCRGAGLTMATDGLFGGDGSSGSAKLMPLGALPTPAQIADAVVYLARAEAVTGQTIFVDGGAHLARWRAISVALERD